MNKLGTKVAQDEWMGCINAVQTKCINPPSSKPSNDSEYTAQQACLTIKRLKMLKTSLGVTTNIQEKVLEISKDNKSGFVFNKNNEEEKGSDDLTTITSGEIKRAYIKELNKEQVIAEECLKQKGELDDKCKELLSNYTGDEKKLQKLYDTQLATGMAAKDSRNKIKDIDAQKEYILKEQNLSNSDKELKAQKNNLEEMEDLDIEALKEKISKQYDKEQKALMGSIQEQLALAKETDKTKMERTALELKEKASKSKDLIHYNNVISGYMSATLKGAKKDGDSLSVSNAKIIKAELKDSAFSDDEENRGRSPANSEPPQATWIARIEESGILDQQGNQKGDGSLTVETKAINKNVLKISTEEVKK